jgi:hypothetical protein
MQLMSLSVVLISIVSVVALNLLASFPAIVVGKQKQLFVDHRFIESSEGVELRMNPPYQTGEKLLVMDQEWETENFIGPFCTVLREDGPAGQRTRGSVRQRCRWRIDLPR